MPDSVDHYESDLDKIKQNDCMLIQSWFKTYKDVELSEDEAYEFWRHYSNNYYSASWLFLKPDGIKFAVERVEETLKQMGAHKWKL